MLHYEAALLLKPDLSDKDVQKFVQEIKELLVGHGATDLEQEKIERRALSYPLKKHNEGYYVFIGFFGPAVLPNKMKLELRHREELLRLAFIRKPAPTSEPEPAVAVAAPVVDTDLPGPTETQNDTPEQQEALNG